MHRLFPSTLESQESPKSRSFQKVSHFNIHPSPLLRGPQALSDLQKNNVQCCSLMPALSDPKISSLWMTTVYGFTPDLLRKMINSWTAGGDRGEPGNQVILPILRHLWGILKTQSEDILTQFLIQDAALLTRIHSDKPTENWKYHEPKNVLRVGRRLSQ